MTNYTQAPLPFQGQKRRFLKDFKEALKNYSPTATYVDLFGGSGLLSHTVKQMYPDAKVIYNDFDGYKDRLQNVENTNALLSDIREIVKDCEKDKKLDEQYRQQILDRLKAEKGFVDYVTISSNVLFSAKYVTDFDGMTKQSMYNNVRLSSYKVDDYLQDVEVVCKDYKDLFELYKNEKNVVLLVDPPYLSTDVSTYNKTDYWKLSDYLDVLNVLKEKPYFYFTSNKSQIVELANWIGSNTEVSNPFKNAITKVVSTTLNHTAKYNDIMIFKHE